MALPMRFTRDAPPWVAVSGAGNVGRAAARRYVTRFRKSHSSFAKCLALGEPDTRSSGAATQLVVWCDDDPGTEAELAQWERALGASGSRVVIGIAIGSARTPFWNRPVLRIGKTALEDGALDLALDAIVCMLVGDNVVNLRVHELREVVTAGDELVFAVGQSVGASAIQEAFCNAATQPAIIERWNAVAALWMHAVTDGPPNLDDLDKACAAARARLRKGGVIWAGATASTAPIGGARVSLMAATRTLAAVCRGAGSER